MNKNGPDRQPDAFDVEVWLTKPDRSALCAKQSGYLAGPSAQGQAIIKVNPARTHQVMDGFGLALTGGSADLIASLAPATRDALLRELFLTDNGGIGISYLRISIGASDLSSSTFSYDDVPVEEADPGLDRFNLEAGDVAVIPMLKAIHAINPAIRIIATPWSAPPWMKSHQSFAGGNLRRDYYQIYARGPCPIHRTAGLKELAVKNVVIERRLKLPELWAHKDFVQNSPRSPQFLLPDQMVEGHIAVGRPDPVFVYPLLGNHRVQMRQSCLVSFPPRRKGFALNGPGPDRL